MKVESGTDALEHGSGLFSICGAAGVDEQHPGDDLVGHPVAKLAEHGAGPFGGAGGEDVLLDELVADGGDDGFVAVDEAEGFKGLPDGCVGVVCV